jgi:prohead serine protease
MAISLKPLLLSIQMMITLPKRPMMNKVLATSASVRDYLASRKIAGVPSNRFVQLAPDGQTSQFSHQDSGVLAVDTTEMSADFLISTTRRDRHGDIVVPKGCIKTLPDYEKNPRIFFAHRSTELPIASSRNPKTNEFTLWVEEEKITSRAFFHGKTQLSDDVFELIVSKDLQAASIGFQPLIARLMEGAEQPQDGETIDFDMGGLIFDEWSLFEWSVVPVPANPDAIRGWLSSKRGMKADKAVRVLLSKALPKQSGISVSMPRTIKTMKKNKVKAAPMTGPQDDQHKEVQAFVFDINYFPDEQSVVAWLGENGYSSEEVYPGDEGDEPFVALQFPAEKCEVGSAKREEVEPGVQAVICSKMPDGDGPNRPEDDASHGDDRHVTNRVDPRSFKNKGKKNMKLADELDNMDDKSETVPENEAGDDKPESEHEGMPHGCKMLKDVVASMKGACDCIDKGMGPLEHEGVKSHMEALHASLSEHQEASKAFAKETYPEHFKDEEGDEEEEGKKKPEPKEKPEEEEEGFDDDEDEGKKSSRANKLKIVAKMAKKDLSVVAEICDFLQELAEEENLKKSQKAGCKLHGASLKELQTKYERAEPVEDGLSEKQKQKYEKALAKLTDAMTSLKNQFYKLTGKEI